MEKRVGKKEKKKKTFPPIFSHLLTTSFLRCQYLTDMMRRAIARMTTKMIRTKKKEGGGGGNLHLMIFVVY